MAKLFIANGTLPKSLIIAAAIVNAADEMKLVSTTITYGRNGKHMVGSKHYTDEALDFRTHDFDEPTKDEFVRVIRRRLGPEYQVFIEDRGLPNEHGHAEYQPR